MAVSLAYAARTYEHQLTAYRRTWRGSAFNSFLQPVMFLLAMGVGLGGYVDRSGSVAGGIPYLVFLAPGLLAGTAMQTAAFESTFPVLGGMIWDRRYHAMQATPLRPADIALGQLGWAATRLTFVTTVFVAVMVAFGAVRSPLVALAIPAAVLTGLAFAAPIAAFAATLRTMSPFNSLFRFGITPLFLFSGTFFPIDRLPEPVRPVAWLTPLYHGVELTRGLSLGTIADRPLEALVHVALLAALVVGGALAATVTFRRRLAG